MKSNSYLSLVLLSISVVGLGACSSIMPKKTGKIQESAEVKKESVLPNDRENIVPPVSAVYTSAELAKGIIKGDWSIETVDGKKAIGERAPYLKFSPDEKKAYGNNGCNFINAAYVYNPVDSTLSFSNVVSTMMACQIEGITDIDINRALDATRYYSWNLQGDDYFMTFYNSDRQPVMELMHQNFQFLNGTWAVKEIEGEAVNVPDMKLVIDVDEGKLHGNTGCNIINGTLETDMDAANSISFHAIAKTKMACPTPNYETPFLVALEEATKAKPLKEGRVILLDNSDKAVLLLERTSDQ